MEALRRLKTVLAPILLRRTKASPGGREDRGGHLFDMGFHLGKEAGEVYCLRGHSDPVFLS